MAIRVKKTNNVLDIYRGHNFVPDKFYPQGDQLHILDYNSNYLSVYFDLRRPGKERIDAILGNDQHKTFNLSKEGGIWLWWVLPEFNRNENRPWFIINGNTDLLARTKLSGEELKLLRGKEVAFYFYEPLFQLNPNDPERWPAFYDESTDIIFPELEWLDQFLTNHDDVFSAVVYVCDYGLRDYLRSKEKYQHLDVRTWDLFVLDTCVGFYWQAYDENKVFAAAPVPFQSEFSKKFICANFRYEGIRELIASYLLGADYQCKGHISFFYKSTLEKFQKDLPFDPKSLKQWNQIQKGRELLQANIPMTLDTSNNVAVSAGKESLPDVAGKNVRDKAKFDSFYRDAFLAVVNESRYSVLCGEVSEKVLQPIMNMRPFVIAGGPYMLRYLRELGFKTFSDFWDESYDEITDHAQRAEAIMQTLDGILSRPHEELQQLLLKMYPVLEYNRRHLTLGLKEALYQDLRGQL